MDKPSWYILFDNNHNKIREAKYFYDNGEYGDAPSKGDLTKKEDWLDTGGGDVATYYQYDDFGNLYRQTDALGRTTTYDYGSKDNTHTYPDRITNALGHSVDYEYDVATGNVLSYTKHGVKFDYVYDNFSRIVKDIDPYDTLDLPTKKYEYLFDGLAPEIILVKQKTTSNNTIDAYYFYDGFANLVQIKTPAEQGQVVKNFFYDGLFRVKSEQIPFIDSFSSKLSNLTNLSNSTKYKYDASGRIISVVNPDSTFKNTTYNKWNISDYDENGNRHDYQLDAHDRIILVREYNTDYYILDNETYNTTYSYDASDNLVGIRDTYGNEFNFTFDSIGRKTQLNDPDLGKWRYEYDLAGNLIRQIDNREKVIKLGYDSLNRIVHKNYSEENISFTYDKQYQGTLFSVNYTNVSFSYTYDDRLRIVKEFVIIDNLSFETGVTYDSMDRILEKRLPNSTDLEFYYNQMNKLDRINGFINKTNYNAFGATLNRTYFNGRITKFDYNELNLRLRQIRTDDIQQLNYSYDNVGNIVSINDSINNRSYAMSYDRLDRLTNVTINNFNWIYSYDPIGRILKVVRNSSQTTSFKYLGKPVHAPSKVITTNTGVDIYRTSVINGSNRTQIVQFYIVNEKNQSLSQINYSVAFGDSFVFNSSTLSLALKGFTLISIERNYTTGGNYLINVTARANTTSYDYESFRLLFGTIANSLSILKQNGSLVVAEFEAQNNIGANSQNWGFNCSHSIISNVPFNISSAQSLMVIIEHDFTTIPSANLTCRINSTDGNQSVTLPFNFDNIKIENYNSTVFDIDTILVKFEIKNYYSSLNNINWTLTADALAYNASGITLNQGQSTTITQEVNFTNAGTKKITVTINSGNFTDSYSENIRLYSLGIQQYINYIKNGTTRIFNFIVKNDWTSTKTKFNITDPALENTTTLANNESIIVVIEENYNQGKKDVAINAMNSSNVEDVAFDVFSIKQIGINKLETLFENTSMAVTSSFVVNNINPLNISWKLNNTEALILSSENLELNTS